MSDVMGAKKRQTLSKKQLDQKILRANKKLALKRENIKSDIKKKESLIKSLDDDISVSRSSINVLNREFKDIEGKFDREKARISKEKARVSDLEKMSDLYHNAVIEDTIDEDLKLYGESLRRQLDIPVSDLDEYQSKFFKFVMPQKNNKGVQDREYQ